MQTRVWNTRIVTLSENENALWSHAQENAKGVLNDALSSVKHMHCDALTRKRKRRLLKFVQTLVKQYRLKREKTVLNGAHSRIKHMHCDVITTITQKAIKLMQTREVNTRIVTLSEEKRKRRLNWLMQTRVRNTCIAPNRRTRERSLNLCTLTYESHSLWRYIEET